MALNVAACAPDHQRLPAADEDAQRAVALLHGGNVDVLGQLIDQTRCADRAESSVAGRAAVILCRHDLLIQAGDVLRQRVMVLASDWICVLTCAAELSQVGLIALKLTDHRLRLIEHRLARGAFASANSPTSGWTG